MTLPQKYQSPAAEALNTYLSQEFELPPAPFSEPTNALPEASKILYCALFTPVS